MNLNNCEWKRKKGQQQKRQRENHNKAKKENTLIASSLFYLKSLKMQSVL